MAGGVAMDGGDRRLVYGAHLEELIWWQRWGGGQRHWTLCHLTSLSPWSRKHESVLSGGVLDWDGGLRGMGSRWSSVGKVPGRRRASGPQALNKGSTPRGSEALQAAGGRRG